MRNIDRFAFGAVLTNLVAGCSPGSALRIETPDLIPQDSSSQTDSGPSQDLQQLRTDLAQEADLAMCEIIFNINVTPGVFNPHIGEKTKISFVSKATSGLDVSIYDLNNNKIETLLRTAEAQSPLNPVELEWDGKDNGGNIVPPGRYLITFTAHGCEGKGYVTNITVTVL